VLETNYAQHVNSLCRQISEFVGCWCSWYVQLPLCCNTSELEINL